MGLRPRDSESINAQRLSPRLPRSNSRQPRRSWCGSETISISPRDAAEPERQLAVDIDSDRAFDDRGAIREESAIVTEAEARVFERQLNKLFEGAQEKLSNLAVVGAMLERGCSISAPYLSQLRTGVRTNPSPRVVEALADIFGVPSDYFYDVNAVRASPATERCGEITDADAAVVERLLDRRLRRLLALSLTLPPTSVEILIDVSDRFRLADLSDDAR